MLYNNFMDSLKSQIVAYIPSTERETSDKALILHCIETFPDVLTRNNPICHFTSSCWIVNPKRTKALILFHNIEQAWMWPGGHADGESNLLSVALREAKEETNLPVHPISKEIFSMEVFAVPPHIRKGKFVSSHLHLNCSFLLEASEEDSYRIKPDENSSIRWMTFGEIMAEIDRNHMSPHFENLIERCKKFQPSSTLYVT